MVSEPHTEQYANNDAGLPRGVDCEIPHRLERRMKHGCGNFSLTDAFYNREADYLLVVGLSGSILQNSLCLNL